MSDLRLTAGKSCTLSQLSKAMHLAAVEFLPRAMSCPGLRTLVTPQFLTVLDLWYIKKPIVFSPFTTERLGKEKKQEGKEQSGQKNTRGESEDGHTRNNYFSCPCPGHCTGDTPGRSCPPEYLTKTTDAECLQSTLTDWALSPRPEFKLNAEQNSQGLGSY